MPPSGQRTATERPATPLWPVYVPRPARSGSNPMQLLDLVARELLAEPGSAVLGKALSQDIQLSLRRHALKRQRLPTRPFAR